MRSGLSIRSLPEGCERTDGQPQEKFPASVFRIFRERKGIGRKSAYASGSIFKAARALIISGSGRTVEIISALFIEQV